MCFWTSGLMWVYCRGHRLKKAHAVIAGEAKVWSGPGGGLNRGQDWQNLDHFCVGRLFMEAVFGCVCGNMLFIIRPMQTRIVVYQEICLLLMSRCNKVTDSGAIFSFTPVFSWHKQQGVLRKKKVCALCLLFESPQCQKFSKESVCVSLHSSK